MRRINIAIKILDKNERYGFTDLIFDDAVLRDLDNNNYEILKDRYGYFEGSKRKDKNED